MFYYFLLKMSKSKRKLLSVFSGEAAVLGAWRERVRKASQGKGGEIGP